MKEQQRNEIKVGIAVLVGLIILIGGFSVLKEWSISSDVYVVSMRFPTSAGLQTGDPVAINGVRAGKVELVAIDGNAVRVTARLSGAYRLTEDASPRIQMVELMGGKQIEIRQGTSPRSYDPARTLEGTVDPDIAGALNLVGKLQGRIEDLASQGNMLLANANAILGDTAFVRTVKSTAAQLHAIASDMRSLLRSNASDVTDITRTVAGLTHRVDTLLAELHPRLSKSLTAADRLAVHADTLLSNVGGMVTDMRTGGGLIQRAMTDTALAHRLDVLLTKLDSVTTLITDGQLRIKIRL